MHHPASVFSRNKICRDDTKRIRRIFIIRKKRNVRSARQKRTRDFGQNSIFFTFEHFGNTIFTNDIHTGFVFNRTHGVEQFRIHSEEHITRKCPRRCGPGNDMHFLFTNKLAIQFIWNMLKNFWRKLSKFKLYIERNILHIFVAFAHLLLRQRCFTARANIHGTIIFVHEPLVPKLFEHPPDRLHIVFVHRAIGMIKIYPTAEAGNRFFPVFYIAKYFATAKFVKRGDPEGFNFFFGFGAQFFFNNVFDRQTVTIPSPAALHAIPLHGPKARHHVFHERRNKVAVVRRAGSKWRTIIKNIGLVSWFFRNGFFKNLVFSPKFKDFVFFVVGVVEHIKIKNTLKLACESPDRHRDGTISALYLISSSNGLTRKSLLLLRKQ